MKHTAEQVKWALEDYDPHVPAKRYTNKEVHLIDEIKEQALRQYLATLEGKAWHVEARPIEEAPKDGTLIDVVLADASAYDRSWYCHGNSNISHGWSFEYDRFRPATGLILTCFVEPTHALTFNGSFEVPVIKEGE